MNVLTITSLVDTEVFVPVFAFANGARFDPSAWTVDVSTRLINTTTPLVYSGGAWELDDLGVQCAKKTLNLAVGRYELWHRVTTPSGIWAQQTGVVVVVAP